MIKKLLEMFHKWNNFLRNDPLISCQLYREKGCSFVDGMLCDFPSCSMNNEYVRSKNK